MRSPISAASRSRTSDCSSAARRASAAAAVAPVSCALRRPATALSDSWSAGSSSEMSDCLMLAQHQDEARDPVRDRHEVDRRMCAACGLAAVARACRTRDARECARRQAGTSARWRTRPGRTGGGSSAARPGGAAPARRSTPRRSGSRGRSGRGRRTCAGGSAGRPSRAPPARCARSRSTPRAGSARPAHGSRRGRGRDVFLDDSPEDRLSSEVQRAGGAAYARQGLVSVGG